jgi:hypothetical protein
MSASVSIDGLSDYLRQRGQIEVVVPKSEGEYHDLFDFLGVSYSPYVYIEHDVVLDIKTQLAGALSEFFDVADSSGLGGMISINPNPIPVPLVELVADDIEKSGGLVTCCLDFQKQLEESKQASVCILIDFCKFESLLINGRTIILFSYFDLNPSRLLAFLSSVM